MKLLVLAAAAAVLVVAGAGARGFDPPLLLSYGPAAVSPDGNGVNDTLRVRVRAAGPVDLVAFVWGGRLHGWRELSTGVSGPGPGTLTGRRLLWATGPTW